MSQHSYGRVIRNIIALLITQLGTWTITLVLTLVLPRYLGVQLYGVYAFVFSFAGFVAIGMNLGMGTYLTWRIARHPEEAGKLTFNALIIQIPLAIVFSLLAIEVVSLMDTSLLVIHLIVITAAGAAGAAMVATCVAGLAGLQNMRVPSFIGLGCSVAGTAAILIAVHLNADIVVLAACGLGAQAISLISMLLYTQVKLHLWGPIDLRIWPKLIRGGMPFFAWAVVLMFYGQVDITLTKLLAGDTVVGWYAAANRIVSIPVFLPTIVVTAILPALSHERVPSSPRFRELASRSMRVVTLVSIPAAVGTVLLANHLVSLLRFPTTFNQVGPLIVILGINMPLIGLDMVLGTVLIAIGRQKAWTGVGIISAIFNPLANLWAIPYTQHLYGNGAIGAATVTLATEFIMLLGALVLLPRPLFTWSDLGYIVRCLIAAALMVPAVRALAGSGTLSIALAVTYGAVVYTMAAYILRLITNNDVRGVTQVIQARLGANGTQLDGRMVADSALRMLSNVQNAAQTAAGRIKTISRPLASGAAYVMGSISQPLAVAARQTALRVGGAISRPLGASGRSTDRPASVGSIASADPPMLPQFGSRTGAEANPSGIPPWGLPATAPLPSLAEVLAQATADDDGDGLDQDEEARRTSPPEWPKPPTPGRATTNGHGTHSHDTHSHDTHSRGANSRPKKNKPSVPAPAPVRSRVSTDLPGRVPKWTPHTNSEG